MFNLIVDSWFAWLLCAIAGIGLLQFIARNRRNDVQPGMATKSDQFSMKTVFFNFKSGEATLFFTVFIVLVFVLLFAIGIARELSSALPS